MMIKQMKNMEKRKRTRICENNLKWLYKISGKNSENNSTYGRKKKKENINI